MMRLLLPPNQQSTQPQQHVILDTILQGLYRRYLERVPQVGTIVDHIVQRTTRAAARDGDDRTTSATSSSLSAGGSPVDNSNSSPVTMMVENDHIAFRSLRLPNNTTTNHHHHHHHHHHGGIAKLERYFIHYCGYTKRDYYDFVEKKLNAHWYSPPPHTSYPRIFISELRVDELSDQCQAILSQATVAVDDECNDGLPPPTTRDDNDVDDKVALGNAILAKLQAPIFADLTWRNYELLKNESEYAAWVYGTNSHDMNHWTLAVHNLPPPINELPALNEMVTTELRIALNAPASPIQISPDRLLFQSSTVTEPLAVSFIADDGDGDDTTIVGGSSSKHIIKYIPGSYVEFAERRVLPQFAHLSPDQIRREHRREGFEMANANVIFESTHS